MKQLFYFFILLAIIYSCKKDCNETPIVKFPSTVTGYYYDFGQTAGYNSSLESFDFVLTYNSKGKIIRRNGYTETTEFSPNDIQTVENYDSLSYKADTIYIFNKWHNITYNIFTIKTEYTVIFNENGILKREQKNGLIEEFYYDNNRIDSSYLLFEINPGTPLLSNAKKYYEKAVVCGHKRKRILQPSQIPRT